MEYYAVIITFLKKTDNMRNAHYTLLNGKSKIENCMIPINLKSIAGM